MLVIVVVLGRNALGNVAFAVQYLDLVQSL